MKKLLVAAENRLQNTFRHRERVLGMQLAPQLTMFQLHLVLYMKNGLKVARDNFFVLQKVTVQ